MLNRLKISISKPGFVFAFIKDNAGKVIKHLLLMMLLLGLPAILSTFNNPKALFPSTSLISKGINDEFSNHDIIITDNVLNNPSGLQFEFTANDYAFVVGEGTKDVIGMVVHFKSEEIQIYAKVSSFMTQQYRSIPYSETKLNNIEFEASDAGIIANEVVTILSSDNVLKGMKVFQIMFSNIVEYFFIALLLAFLFKMSNRLPLPFKNSFTVSIYLTSIWAITILILTLFGYQHLSFIALILTYIYHIWAYRSISMVRKIEVPKENDKK